MVWFGANRDAKRGEGEGKATLFSPPPPLKSQIFSLLTPRQPRALPPSPPPHQQGSQILWLKSPSFAVPDPVHGNWSEWTPYTVCSKTCGGIKTRSRTCTNPAPAFDGIPCHGHSIEDVACSDNCSGQCNYHSVLFLFHFVLSSFFSYCFEFNIFCMENQTKHHIREKTW